jgi:hypothetical protein
VVTHLQNNAVPNDDGFAAMPPTIVAVSIAHLPKHSP